MERWPTRAENGERSVRHVKRPPREFSTEGMLLEIAAEAALDAGRELRVIERRTQAQDHPIFLTVPETHYLKCLVLQVV
jgi:23S rRNA G2069 N7-methylase RlmK/C1962 C5-methylase RlmI